MQESPDPSLSFHNVAEFSPRPGGGFALHRFPGDVMKHLSMLGKLSAIEATGVEIRFISEAPSFRLVFEARPSAIPRHAALAQEITVYRGDFCHSRHYVRPGEKNVLTIYDVGGDLDRRFEQVDSQALAGRFSPAVWRICFARNEVIFHELDTFGMARRPPVPYDLPAQRWLAYGSSITQGADASSHHLAYVYGAARHLGVDVLNFGLGGSCLCEPEMAEYLTSRPDWDLAFFELGVNMRGRFDVGEFESRTGYLLKLVDQRRGSRQVFVTGIYLNSVHLVRPEKDDGMRAKQEQFCRILQIHCEERNLCYLEPLDVLKHLDGLTCDLLHPSDHGYQEMGINLSKMIKTASGDL